MSLDEIKDVATSSPQATEAGLPPLNEAQQFGYETARAFFARAFEAGYLNSTNIHRILDFGSGLGGPTLGIIDATRENSPHIDAVEKEEIWVNILRRLNILPPENIIHGDGLLYLENLTQNGIAPYDLITAFNIGQDGAGRIFRRIAVSANTSLTPNGNLLITSNDQSLVAAINACREADVPYYLMEGEKAGRRILVPPHALIVPRSSCVRIQPLEIPMGL